MMRPLVAASLLALVMVSGFGLNTSAQQGGFTLPPLLMTSPAFEDGGIIPDEHTCAAGQGVPNPAFSWTGAPDDTESYAIIFHDLDVGLQSNPADAGGIPEGMPPGTLSNGTVQGRGITRQNGYFGPCAPAGERYHHYVWELYALSEMLDLPDTAGRNELLEVMVGKVTAKAAYVGRFHQEQ